ncbi:MAG TPA: YcaO-like family protein, partial [Pseudonocardiaceae bacterium]|nr:YcaO-like family protein [Pseudonocardiaceae bacterium]
PPGLVAASYRELQAARTPALDPAELILYSAEQYGQRGFPFQPFGPDLRVRWTAGWELATGDPILVPASLVYFNYHRGRYADEPRTNFMIMPGVATGPDRHSAARTALAEVVERDAVTLWWQRGHGATAVDTEPDGFPATLLAGPELAGPDGAIRLDYHLFQVPSDLGVPVLAALVDDQAFGVVSVGSSYHPTPRIAATKALAEAIQLRAFSLDLRDPRSRVWRGILGGTRATNIVKPFRADHAYLGAGRPGFRDAIDFAAHAQLYLDPLMRGHLSRLLHPCRREPLPPASDDDLLGVLCEAGFRTIAVDLSTPDIAACGLSVVRVLVPGLYPNAPAAFPFLGGERLYHLPENGDAQPGTRALSSADLVRAPMPGM